MLISEPLGQSLDGSTILPIRTIDYKQPEALTVILRSLFTSNIRNPQNRGLDFLRKFEVAPPCSRRGSGGGALPAKRWPASAGAAARGGELARLPWWHCYAPWLAGGAGQVRRGPGVLAAVAVVPQGLSGQVRRRGGAAVWPVARAHQRSARRKATPRRFLHEQPP